mmetsp:Transcript_4254/g.7301  ORF Transcript_4254/g.7301 Transcript_4254/m.7301 type:complete len:83 (-) Transcript_4254:68-316(-)
MRRGNKPVSILLQKEGPTARFEKIVVQGCVSKACSLCILYMELLSERGGGIDISNWLCFHTRKPSQGSRSNTLLFILFHTPV